MRKFLKDMLYALTALGKAFERIAECLEDLVDQDKKNVKQREESLTRLNALFQARSPLDSSLFDDTFGMKRK